MCEHGRGGDDRDTRANFGTVDIASVLELLIESLGTAFGTEETVLIERLLRENAGTIPDAQLISEIGLALAIHRRQRQR